MATKKPSVKAMGNGRLLVKRIDPDKISKGGIHIAEQSQYEKHEAIVVAVGKGSFVDFTPEGTPRYEPVPYNVGDHIFFSKYGGVEWTDPETTEKYQILLCEDVMLVLND